MSNALDTNRGWWTYLTKYHWYVFALASLGWLFDTMDGQIFLASRSESMKYLMPDATDPERLKHGGYVTFFFMIGWATGGLIFGIIGDRWGRAKTMALTIMLYAVFTGLSGLATDWIQFSIFRFLTGLGVGGEFAAGAAMVSEAMPEQARAKALGMLQGLSAVGNVIGASLFGFINPRWGWRWLYAIGAFPAILAVIVRLGMKESDKWIEAKQHAKDAKEELGKITDLFTIPKWRKNTFIGLGIAIPGIIGVWSIGFYSPELIDSNFPKASLELRGDIESIVKVDEPEQAKMIAKLPPVRQKQYSDFIYKTVRTGETRNEDATKVVLNTEQKSKATAVLVNAMIPAEQDSLKMWGLIVQQLGAFCGMFGFCLVAQKLGRRLTFLVAFLLAWASVLLTFYTLHSSWQVYYLLPIMGMATLAPMGGFVLYFPELFPTRLRTTGIGFCYNVGRYVSAFAPPAMTALAASLNGKFEMAGFRAAAIIMASVYFLGMLVLIWAPETVNKPLPED